MAVVPFGPLLSFGTIILDETRTTEPIGYKFEWVTAYETGPGLFPIDKRGLSPAPRKLPQGTWKYLIVATPGPGAASAVEQALADLVTAVETPYTYFGPYLADVATVAGELGDLVVLRANQTDAMQCFARLEMLDVQVKAGRPYSIEIPLQFTFLSAWSAV